MPRQWLRVWRWNRGLRDRRQQRQRIERYFDCTWRSVWGEQRSRISSLSPTGCYIDSRLTAPAEGTVVRDLTLAFPTDTLILRGTVLATMRGIGFAVRFTDLDDDTRDRLSALISSVRQSTCPAHRRPPADERHSTRG
jgi:PilZ domain-containing protein